MLIEKIKYFTELFMLNKEYEWTKHIWICFLLMNKESLMQKFKSKEILVMLTICLKNLNTIHVLIYNLPTTVSFAQ